MKFAAQKIDPKQDGYRDSEMKNHTLTVDRGPFYDHESMVFISNSTLYISS